MPPEVVGPGNRRRVAAALLGAGAGAFSAIAAVTGRWEPGVAAILALILLGGLRRRLRRGRPSD